jgi:hypothetical protein
MAVRGVVRTEAEITSPFRGVAQYRTANGALVMFIHYSADPTKQHEWAKQVSSDYAGGMNSAKWLREYEGDPDATDGERTYWAFQRSRNVVPRFPIPADWPISVGVDFGQTNATCFLFVAQDPISRRVYVFDSIYQPRGISDDVKRRVYEIIAKHRSVEMPELLITGLERYLERIVGDPSGAAYVAFYARDPFPIYIATNTHKTAMQRLQASESHVNSGLFPSFFHCGTLQYQQQDEQAVSECTRCHVPVKGRPLVYLMEGASIELEAQLEKMVRAKPLNPLLETPEKSVKMPDHAADALRYVLRTMAWDPPENIEEAMRDARMDALKRRRFGHDTFEELMELEEMEADAASAEAGRGDAGAIRITRLPRSKAAGGIYVH